MIYKLQIAGACQYSSVYQGEFLKAPFGKERVLINKKRVRKEFFPYALEHLVIFKLKPFYSTLTVTKLR